jgi:predicted transcriptional regulator
MADGGLKIELDAALGARLRDAADAAGQSTDEYASTLIAQALDEDWAEARAGLAHYDRTGEYVDAKEAMASFRVRLRERLDRGR